MNWPQIRKDESEATEDSISNTSWSFGETDPTNSLPTAERAMLRQHEGVSFSHAVAQAKLRAFS
jgi:hypothetical protein